MTVNPPKKVIEVSDETDSFQSFSRGGRRDLTAQKHHQAQLSSLINEYEENGDSENVVRIKTENAFLPVNRKELRKVLLE